MRTCKVHVPEVGIRWVQHRWRAVEVFSGKGRSRFHPIYSMNHSVLPKGDGGPAVLSSRQGRLGMYEPENARKVFGACQF